MNSNQTEAAILLQAASLMADDAAMLDGFALDESYTVRQRARIKKAAKRKWQAANELRHSATRTTRVQVPAPPPAESAFQV